MILPRSDIARAMSASLTTRDVSSDVNGVKHTFSGWDSCMQKAYCKWPVIVAIIIGSLIVLSVVFCVARCLCCGAECACCCFRCCTGCCRSSGRSSRRNNAYAPAPQPIYQQPQPYSTPYSSAAPPTYSTKPQFARFDVSRKGPGGGDSDSLPPMPSWDNATSHKIEVEEEPEEGDITEMQHLDPHNNKPGSPAYPAAAAATMRSNQATPAQAYGGAGAMPGYAHRNSSGHLDNYSTSNLSHQQQNPYNTNTPYHNPQGPYSPPHSPPHQQGYGYADSSVGGYAPSGSTSYEPSSSPTAYAPRQYQAYGGGAGGVDRKPVQGSWKDI